MITANATPIPSGFQLEIIYPDKQPVQFAKVRNQGEGLRLIYFHNRRYVTDKLISWLKQRMYAAREAGENRITAAAAQLSVTLNYNRDTSLKHVCDLVKQNVAAIESIAPGERSRFFNHYNQVIKPIINFCQNFKEEEI